MMQGTSDSKYYLVAGFFLKLFMLLRLSCIVLGLSLGTPSLLAQKTQDSEAFVKAGITKAQEEDFFSALRDFTRAIELDPKNTDAWYYKAMCFGSMGQDDSSMACLNSLISNQPNYAPAYIGRAEIYARTRRFTEALTEVNRALELDSVNTYALITRGQLYAVKGAKLKACEEFRKALALGDKQAPRYLEQYCGSEQPKGESLMLYWPEEENWKIGAQQSNDEMSLLELIPASESLENWTELGHMMTLNGMHKTNLDSTMQILFQTAKSQAPDAILKVYDTNNSDVYPWLIFSIESSAHGYAGEPESQMWLLRQGKDNLYMCFRAVKDGTLPAKLIPKWKSFFQGSKVMFR